MKKKKADFYQRASLFVGRWQPFHEGHKKLIETVLKRGKPVVIAIRHTKRDKKNPYTIAERRTMIQWSLRKYGKLVKIVSIPDIDEICYGRDVGYNIRRITLDAETERITATTEREKKPSYPIYWITGQSNSGKTTLAKALRRKIGGIILDGNEMRESISLGAGFSRRDRHKHNLRVARLAKVLSKRDTVIVAVIAPFERTRQEITKMINPIWVYVKRKLPRDPEKPYEPPKHPHVVVNPDRQTVQEEVEIILKIYPQHSY